MVVTVRLLLGILFLLIACLHPITAASWRQTRQIQPKDSLNLVNHTSDELQPESSESIAKKVLLQKEDDQVEGTKPKTEPNGNEKQSKSNKLDVNTKKPIVSRGSTKSTTTSTVQTIISTALPETTETVVIQEAGSTKKEKATTLRIENARSLDIDIDKYVSPEFHNKNNVYSLPTSPENKKFIKETYEGFTTPESFTFTKFHHNFDEELTTPSSQFFDEKHKQFEKEVQQNLGVIEEELGHNENIEDLLEKSKQNGTKSNLEYLEYKHLNLSDTQNKNHNHLDTTKEQGLHLSFNSTFNDTKIIDEQNIIPITSPGVDDSEKSRNASSKESTDLGNQIESVLSPEESQHNEKIFNISTQRPDKIHITKPPKLNETQDGLLSNKIENETVKPTEEVKTKRPSTIFVQATTNAISTASNRGTAKYQTTEITEQTVQENQIIPVKLPPPTTEIFNESTTFGTTQKQYEATETTINTSTADEGTTIRNNDNITTTENENVTTTFRTEFFENTTHMIDTTTTESTTLELNTTTEYMSTSEPTSSNVQKTEELSTTVVPTESGTTFTSPTETSTKFEDDTQTTLIHRESEQTTEFNETTTNPSSTGTTITESFLPNSTEVPLLTESTTSEIETTSIFAKIEVTTEESNGTTTTDIPVRTTEVLKPTLVTTTVDDIDKTTTIKTSHVPDHTTTENEIITTTLRHTHGSKLPDFVSDGTTKPIYEHTTEEALNPRIFNGSTTEATDSSTADNLELPSTTDDDEGSGTLIAIIISTVGAICLVLLVGLLIVMRKRQKRFNYPQMCKPVDLDSYNMDNVSVYNSVRRKGAIRASKRSYGNPAFDDPTSVSHPLNFQALAKFTSPEEIKNEFNQIPQVTARTNELPDGCEVKNRYANVIPLPETRVFLKEIEGSPNTDYINANYVTGAKSTKGYYIACQAPMSNTVDDFWRMVWEQQSKVILMLTHLYENGVEKCVDYLPPSEVVDCHRLFGDYQVTLKKRDVKDKYIISSLQLKNMISNSWREVTHLWYLGWPEKGVPPEANSIIAFLIEARSYIKTTTNGSTEATNGNVVNSSGKVNSSPIVIHCSPGTGRTGAVIACDIAIREFEQTRQVDIPRIVYRIRRDRASSVQTQEQYAFIYKVITLYATKLTGGALDSL